MSNGEILESKTKNGNSFYIASDGEREYKITNKNGTITVKDKKTGKIVSEQTVKSETPKVGTFSYQDPGGGSRYRYYGTRHMSLDQVYA